MTGAVVSVLGSGPWRDIAVALALGATRTIPIAWLVPLLGGPRVPSAARVGLGVLLAVLALPVLVPSVAASPALALGPAGWLVLAARELLLGLTVGIAAGSVFRAAEAAGRLADVLRGANLAEVLSPMSDDRTSPTGDLYLFVAVVLFLELGGLRHLASALARSYEAVPVGAAPTIGSARAALEVTLYAVAKLLESAVALAAPVLVALWLADAALGIVGRAAPQLPLYFAAMPAKALLGLGAVLLGLGAVEGARAGGFSAWAALVERAFAAWRAP